MSAQTKLLKTDAYSGAYQIIRLIKKIATYILLVMASLIVLFPLFFSFSLALQGPTIAPTLIPDFSKLDFSAFGDAFKIEKNLGRWILNSFVVSLLVTLGQLITSSLAGYALATLNFPGRSLFFFIFLGTLMIPWESTIITNYLTISNWGWKDSYQGLVAPFLSSGFGIFLMRQYFMTIPRDLYEAAIIDGCGRTRYLWSILLPLSRPALGTLAVYAFLNTWNQYYWPLLVIDAPEWRTTQVGITVFRSSEISVYNLQMAATIIVMLPTLLLLIFGQRQLVRGLTAGALKG
ncbi:MAG: carbohydrate ABC transporter permease [Chloroflexi bacterium]|uniref:Carbohydrate ABC transporter permease n=1 Tax=Candidatus Chlorohelix allophototropha TaxID=3003348 RepID=A0A8T7LXP5_9CHLR|nr:carbohydrate ABC transporter permease [Chloroflexota bacterium]WJW67592.1 carbohydrate ABC transporter permease [Chloroflexota bacterium L227-S17]